MNKIVVVLACVVLMGCAHGVVDEPTDVDAVSTVSPPRAQATVASVEEAVTEPDTSGKKCEVVQTVYADNCVLKVIKCSDGTMDVDAYCYGPPYVPIWEWYPDPPIYKVNSHE